MLAHLARLARPLAGLALLALAAPALAQPPAPPPAPGRAGPNFAPGSSATLGTANTTPPPWAFTTSTPSYNSSPTAGGVPWGYGPYGYYGDYGPGGYARGLADVTAATGQYWKDIQSARMSREYANQMSIDTKRKQLQWELEYEKYRPTAPKMLAAEKATDLDWARKYAQNTEIWSGSTLNVLYRSAIRSKYLFLGPNIPVDDKILRGLNLNDQTTRANGGLLKDNKLYWTETLDGEAYDKNRDAFTKNWNLAQQQLGKDGAIERNTLRDLQGNVKALSEQLDASVADLPPSRYIESNRYLNQLKGGVKALENTRRGRPATYSLVGKARNVAEICAYMAQNGLQFVAATAPEDYTAYSAFYLLLRSFEMSVSGVQ